MQCNALIEVQITVHPIGGACISSDGSGRMGATTHLGEVLAGEGEQFHDGLIVVDGAVQSSNALLLRILILNE